MLEKTIVVLIMDAIVASGLLTFCFDAQCALMHRSPTFPINADDDRMKVENSNIELMGTSKIHISTDGH